MRDRLRWLAKRLIPLGIFGAVFLAMALLVGLVFYGWLGTSSGNRWVASLAENALDAKATNGTVTLERVETNVRSYLIFHDLNIRDDDGRTVVHIGRAQTEISLFSLLFRELKLDNTQLDSVLIDIEIGADGVTNLGRVFGQSEVKPPSDEPWEGLPIEIFAPDVTLNGVNIVYRTPDREVVHLTGLNLTGRIEGKGTRLAFLDIALDGQLAGPGPSVVQADGGLIYTDEGITLDHITVKIPDTEIEAVGTIGGGEIDIDLAVRSLHLPALEPIIGNPGFAGTFSGDLELRGPLSASQMKGELVGINGTKGRVGADVQANLSAEKITWTAEIDLHDFHVEQLYPSVGQNVVLDGEAILNGKGIRFPDDFELTVAYRGPGQDIFGQHLDAIETTFVIENGELRIESTKLSGILGDLEARGDINLVEGPLDLHITGWVHPERLEDLGISGIRTSGWVDARLAGNLKDPDAVFHVRGTLRFAPFRYLEDVRFDSITASFDVEIDGLDIVGTASVDGTGGNTYGLAFGTLRIPTLTLSIPSGGTLRFGGDLTIEDMLYPGTFSVTTATGEWRFDNAPDGTQTTHAELALGPHRIMGIGGQTGALVADIVNDDVAFEVVLDNGRLPLLRTGGRYDLARSFIDLDHLSIQPTPRMSWTATRPVQFTTTDGGLTGADIVLQGNLGTVEITGTLGTSGPLDGRVVVKDLQLDLLSELYPDDYPGLAGVLQLDTTLTGTANNPIITSDIDISGLWMEDSFRWLDVHGSFEADHDNFRPHITIGVAGEPLAHIRGRVNMSLDLAAPGLTDTGEIDIDIGIPAGEIIRLDHLIPDMGTEIPTGVFSGQIKLTGRAVDPDFRYAGTTEIEVRGWDEPARMEYEFTRTGDQIFGWADIRDGMEQRMNLGLSGTTRMSELMAWSLQGGPEPDLEDYTLFLDNMYIYGALLGFPADSIAAAAGLPVDATGSVVGGFIVQGSPYTPVADGSFHWEEATIGTVSLEDSFISMSPVEGGYQLDMHASFEPEGDFAVNGLVPIEVDLNKDWTEWATGNLALVVSGTGVPLGLASGYDPGVQKAIGLLKIVGEITGDPANPSPHLTATVAGGSFNYRPLGLTVQNVRMAFDSSDGLLTLTDLHMVTQPRNRRGNLASGIQDLSELGEASTIDITGSAELGERALGKVEATVTLDGGAWIINTTDTSIRADGEIKLSGVWPELVVVGELGLYSGKVVVDAASFLSAAPLEVDRNLTIRRPNAIILRAPVEEETLYQDFDVALTIQMNRILELDMAVPFVEDFGAIGAAVSRADLTARIGGQATVVLKDGEFGMTGKVDLVEGKIRVLQSKFDLEEGTIAFAGADPYNPIMDIRAQMTIPDATVDMHMTGTPEAPTIDLSSEQYPDKSQVFTILITGQAPDELTADGGLATAQALAGLVVSSLLGGQSLGNFSIEPDGSVRAGAPVTQNIFAVTVVSPNANINENRVALEAEWGPVPHVVVSGGIGDKTTFSDLFWEIRF